MSNEPILSPLFDMQIQLSPNRELIGATPHGLRANVYVHEGVVAGPRLRGTVRPGGADWFTIRPDGVGELDVRVTLEVDNGLVYGQLHGLLEVGGVGTTPGAPAQLPPKIEGTVTGRYETGSADHAWLHRLQIVGRVTVDTVAWTVHYRLFSLA